MPGWAQGPRMLPDDWVLGASQGPLTSKTTLACKAAQSIAPRRKTARTRTFSDGGEGRAARGPATSAWGSWPELRSRHQEGWPGATKEDYTAMMFARRFLRARPAQHLACQTLVSP